jgi:hypothetical protein
MGTRTAVARSTLRWRRGSTPKPKVDLCTASHANGAKHLGTAQLVLRSRSKMYTLVSGGTVALAVALWVAAARLLRKLYLAARREARTAHDAACSRSCAAGKD